MESLPSDSSRSNSASWSLTSLGRADRSTPRSAIVGSTAACGMFAISRMTAGTVRHEATKWNQDAVVVVVVVVFTPYSRLPDTAMTVGDGNNSPGESVSHMTGADGNCCDRMVGWSRLPAPSAVAFSQLRGEAAFLHIQLTCIQAETYSDGSEEHSHVSLQYKKAYLQKKEKKNPPLRLNAL